MNTSSRGHPLRRYVLGSTPEEEDNVPLPSTGPKSKTWQTTVSRIPSWPEEARTLRNHDWVSILFGLGDVILVLLPIYFVRMYAQTLECQYPYEDSAWDRCCYA